MLKLSVASLLIAVLAACGVYAFKGEAQRLERELRRVEAAIEREHVEIKRLNAEWATLSDPARLSRLAKGHLKLEPATPRQLARIDDIPLRDELNQEDAPALVSAIDPDELGSVRR